LPRRNVIIGANYPHSSRARHAKAARTGRGPHGWSIAASAIASSTSVAAAIIANVTIGVGWIGAFLGRLILGCPVPQQKKDAGANDRHCGQPQNEELNEAHAKFVWAG
jgi:hypothetical protein